MALIDIQRPTRLVPDYEQSALLPKTSLTTSPFTPTSTFEQNVLATGGPFQRTNPGEPGAVRTPTPDTNPWAGKSAEDIIRSFFGTHKAESASLDAILQALTQGGHSGFSRATRAGGVPSDDKIQGPLGMLDLIRDVGGPGASWQWLLESAGGGGGGTSGGGGMDASGIASLLSSSFSDPDTRRLLDFINQRLGALTAPVPSGSFDAFTSTARDLATRLREPWQNPHSQQTTDTLMRILSEVSGDPFTSGEWAALRANASDELTKSRDQDIRTTIARMAALGHGKGSGTIAESLRDVESGYQSNRAANDRALQIAAIEQKNRNRDTAATVSQILRQIPMEDQRFGETRESTAVAMLNAIVQAEAQRRAETEGRMSTATTLMGVPVQLGDQRLQQALQVLGLTNGSMDPSNILSTLSTLGNNARANSLSQQSAFEKFYEEMFENLF